VWWHLFALPKCLLMNVEYMGLLVSRAFNATFEAFPTCWLLSITLFSLLLVSIIKWRIVLSFPRTLILRRLQARQPLDCHGIPPIVLSISMSTDFVIV
jgi:hypothetical protein